MSVQCFENDIYLKLSLKLHIFLKQHFIDMFNQELDMFSGLLDCPIIGVLFSDFLKEKGGGESW